MADQPASGGGDSEPRTMLTEQDLKRRRGEPAALRRGGPEVEEAVRMPFLSERTGNPLGPVKVATAATCAAHRSSHLVAAAGSRTRSTYRAKTASPPFGEGPAEGRGTLEPEHVSVTQGTIGNETAGAS
jgi:hypothetical protein